MQPLPLSHRTPVRHSLPCRHAAGDIQNTSAETLPPAEGKEYYAGLEEEWRARVVANIGEPLPFEDNVALGVSFGGGRWGEEVLDDSGEAGSKRNSDGEVVLLLACLCRGLGTTFVSRVSEILIRWGGARSLDSPRRTARGRSLCSDTVARRSTDGICLSHFGAGGRKNSNATREHQRWVFLGTSAICPRCTSNPAAIGSGVVLAVLPYSHGAELGRTSRRAWLMGTSW